MPNPNEDYYGWTQETIEKLRQGRINEVNMEDLIEELEDMGKSERRELRSRLATLLMHLLKRQYQPDRRGKSWRLTIEEQRVMVDVVFKDNPSLRSWLPEIGIESYRQAMLAAARETNLDKSAFPATFEEAGWRWEQVLDSEFYPD